MLCMAGTLTSLGRACSRLWSENFDDAFFLRGLRAWLDTGRITSVMMEGASHVRKSAMSTSLPVVAVRLTGPDRVTSAIAIRATSKSGVWSVDLDSLNMPAMALFSVAKDLDLDAAMPRGELFGPSGKR